MKNIYLVAILCLWQTISFGQKNIHVIETELGNITVELYPEKAPVTVKNFEAYEAQSDFSEASFYRVVRMDNQSNDSIRIEVIQGDFTGVENKMPAIAHETTDISRLKHENGTISMARSEPGTASSSFFICINDQPQLDFGGMRNPDGQGFAAFGKVIAGMDVVKKIQQGKTELQTLVSPIKILRIYRK